MSWQNNGGDRGPWGQGPKKGGGGQPPDIDELIRKGQDKFRSAFGGGGSGDGGESFGSGKSVSFIILGVIALWLYLCIYIVDTDEQAIVLRFGKWIETTDPGIHFMFAPFETKQITKVTAINVIQIGFGSSIMAQKERQMLTGDENIVDAPFSIMWKVRDPAKFQFNLRDKEESVKSIAESAMREVVAKTDVQNVMTNNKNGIELEVMQITQEILDRYDAGIEITQVKMEDVKPPAEISDAFNDVQKAEADRERVISLAKLEQNKIVPQARGKAASMIQEAEGYKQKVIAEAEGQASRFEAILGEYQKAKDVTKRRLYLNTMEQVLSGTNKIVIDNKGGGVVPYLPLPELNKKSNDQQ
ncbi:MAG TPA: FtsH protease activity modulator HflK [Emcibacteraceae bacterium]|nr:FtsH protease activity modulator HflK [Emcibacteraceae bacterium]